MVWKCQRIHSIKHTDSIHLEKTDMSCMPVQVTPGPVSTYVDLYHFLVFFLVKFGFMGKVKRPQKFGKISHLTSPHNVWTLSMYIWWYYIYLSTYLSFLCFDTHYASILSSFADTKYVVCLKQTFSSTVIKSSSF